MQDKSNLVYAYFYEMKFDLIIPVLPLRKEANHRSELINQILFGETFEITQQGDKWSFIQTIHDDYQGWIETNNIFYIKNKINELRRIITSFHAKIKYNDTFIHIPFGSFLVESSFKLLEGSSISKCEPDQALELIQSQLLGAPYLWGGRTGFGIDCSGLTQLFFRLINIILPRDAHQQAVIGDDIFLAQTEPGDLLFYKNAEQKIIHVGIAVDKKYILHASGNVRIDEYDSIGIYNPSLQKYTHEFAFAKRIIKRV